MAVAEHHGAVEAQLACAAGGNDLELARKEVLFFHAVFLGEQREHGRFHRFFFRELLEFGFLGVFLAFGLRGGAAACEHIEVFALDDLGCLLLHLVVGKMDEQVGDAEHGVARVFAHVHALNAAVFFRDNAVNGERKRDPLVLLDAAVVMRVEQRQIARLIERVLLDVQTRAVDVRAQNVQTVLHGAAADVRQDDGLAVQFGVYLVACGELLARGARLVERNVARLARLRDGGRHAFALGLVGADEIDVVGCELLELGQLRLVVCEPCVLVLQSSSFRLGILTSAL